MIAISKNQYNMLLAFLFVCRSGLRLPVDGSMVTSTRGPGGSQ
jgi:hypothetical protein